MDPAPPLPEEYLEEPDRYFMEWIPAKLEEDPELPSRLGQERAELVLNLMTHGSEHLGQAIAYARSIGVAPPWSDG